MVRRAWNAAWLTWTLGALVACGPGGGSNSNDDDDSGSTGTVSSSSTSLGNASSGSSQGTATSTAESGSSQPGLSSSFTSGSSSSTTTSAESSSGPRSSSSAPVSSGPRPSSGGDGSSSSSADVSSSSSADVSSSSGADVSSSSSADGSSSSGSTLPSCGGLGGQVCRGNQWCDFPRDSCGAADAAGTCLERPAACPLALIPVCGCDGLTYGNECEAHQAGVDTLHAGACSEVVKCGGRLGNTCLADQYCDFAANSCGATDEVGSCQQRPSSCPDLYQPVCGCDGQTYGNECDAYANGIDMVSTGACPGTVTCVAGRDSCSGAQFCDWEPDSCGSAVAEGLCQLRPEVCPLEGVPVCGCDGLGYGSSCEAHQAGVDVRNLGACTEPVACGTDTDPPCADSQFCDFLAETCGARGAGTCQERPLVCPLVVAPVCGCDGLTYGNACEAHRAGMDVASLGACATTTVCGGFLGTACLDTQFCDWEPNSCGAADEQGTCVERPGVCPLVVRPVCGCDRQTYGNACEAHAVGVDVASDGACPTATACSPRGPECPPGTFCDYDPDSCGGSSAGTCQVIPQLCPDVVAPVCGCNGTTYNNACEAHLASVDVAKDGPCEVTVTCGRRGDPACALGTYCDFSPNACGLDGVGGTCQLRPLLCAGLQSPVCGCNGQTYGSECEANKAGVDVAHSGSCDALPTACSAMRNTCTDTQFCDFGIDACGAMATPGVCRDRPGVSGCPRLFSPVCGCDGVTYDNECLAQASGTDAAYAGACGEGACGGLGALECDGGLFCDYTPNSCGSGFETGQCRFLPDACDDSRWPVCGCDGLTYLNECQAHAAGMDIRSFEACPVFSPCGGFTGAACLDTQYCDYVPNSCGVTDEVGTCVDRPRICPEISAPVCGCDGLSYRNACLAAQAGVDVASSGGCL